MYANQQDNFGYGWRLEFRDTNLSTSLRPPNAEEELLGEYPSFQDGTKVYNLGRLSKVIQTLDGRRLETEYGYDEAGRLIWQEDAKDNRTSYEYDKLGRRTVVELPTGERSITTYDEVGNVATVTDFNGETIQFVYDEQNRLETKDLPDDVDIQYAYTPDGQVASITDERGTTTFDYDAQGRLIARRDPTGPYINGNSIEYSYDDAGNITQVRTAAGVVDYTYDEQNRLETVKEDNETTRYVYDLAGNLKETQFPNGVIERRTYDELNRLDVLETEKDGTLLSRFDYATNDAGHRLEVIESVFNPTTNLLEERTVRYEYDDLYRLVSEEVVGGDTTSYTYDDVGNRLSKTVNGVTTTYTYDENDLLKVEIAGGTTIEYKYDKNGNLTERKENGVVTATYVWDDQNRMVEVQTPTEIVTYKYDDDNIRVSETTVSGTKNYVLDKNRPYAQVLAEYEDGNLEASYTYGLDLIEQERDGNESYYSVDGLGSTRGLTDENGTVTDTYTYDAYGNVVGSLGSTENDYRFAGEQFDGTLGQYYLRQRYYDPQSGRFTRRDTYEGRLEEPITLHKYLYANSNPVNGIDPSGLFTLTMGSDIYAIAGILATLTYIQLSQNSPEQLGGFGEGPSPKPPSHTGHRPTESLLQRVLSFPGRNAGPKLEHTETFPTNTWENFVQHVFTSGRTGRKVFGETKLKGIAQNLDLDELTHQQVAKSFENTPYTLTNHAISRMTNSRTKGLGAKNLNDIARVLNNGVVVDAGRGEVAIQLGNLEAIVDPETNRIITIRPARDRF